LKSRTDFRHIPVIILSTSNSLFDIREAYESGAALFLEKPHDFQELVEMLQYLLPLAGKYALFAPSR
jgi:CheY-like chemotaxis protein